MNQTFNITSGDYGIDGQCVGSAYSGAPGHVNVAADVGLKGLGPLPTGLYTISEPYTDPEKGPLCFRLTPCGGQEMYNRGGLLIHADNASKPMRSSSEGCVVAGPVLRHAIAVAVAAGSNILEVTA